MVPSKYIDSRRFVFPWAFLPWIILNLGPGISSAFSRFLKKERESLSSFIDV
jgi:hypothetical protein